MNSSGINSIVGVSKQPETMRETVDNRVDNRLIRTMAEKLFEMRNFNRVDYLEQARIFENGVDHLHVMELVKGNRW